MRTKEEVMESIIRHCKKRNLPVPTKWTREEVTRTVDLIERTCDMCKRTFKHKIDPAVICSCEVEGAGLEDYWDYGSN